MRRRVDIPASCGLPVYSLSYLQDRFDIKSTNGSGRNKNPARSAGFYGRFRLFTESFVDKGIKRLFILRSVFQIRQTVGSTFDLFKRYHIRIGVADPSAHFDRNEIIAGAVYYKYRYFIHCFTKCQFN